MLPLENPVIDPCTNTICLTKNLSFLIKVYFLVEIMIKVIAHGLFFSSCDHVRPYLSNKLNCLDAAIVSICTIDLVCTLAGFKPHVNTTLTLIRSLRTLTPLRLIRRSLNLQVVFEALF